MKRFKQQTICVILAFSLCVSFFQIGAIAANDIEENASLITSLRNIETNKSIFGLEDVDFEDFQISTPIKSYICANAGFEESYEYQPLLVNGVLTAFAIEIWKDTAAGYQITTSLVEEINSITFNTANVILVYDRIGCWLYDGEKLICLLENSIENEQRKVLREEDVLLLEQLEFSNISEFSSLGYVSAINSRASILLICSVPYVPQAYTSTCWAATITSILNYTGNHSITQDDVIREQFGVVRNHGIYESDVPALFRAYGLNYSLRYSYSGNTFIDNLQSGYPIYASFDVIEGSGHACVIYLYHIMSCYMQVMDPECGGVYIPCPPAGQEYTYVSPIHNTTLVLHALVSMYP